MLYDHQFTIQLRKHENFILSIVDKYDHNIMSRKDLEIAGKLGFYKAYRNYKEEFNASLVTYSYPYIKGEILEQQNQLKHPHFSDSQLPTYQKIHSYFNKNFGGYYSEIDFVLLEDQTGLDRDDIVRLYVSDSFRIFLDHAEKSKKDILNNLHEKVEQKIFKEPSLEVEAFFLNNEINKRLKILTENQKLVISKLYGLNGYLTSKIHEIAADLKLSASRVGQIRDEAKWKLRNDPIMKQIYLEQFYESYYYGYDINAYSFDN